MSPLLQPLSDIIKQATDMQVKIQGLLASNVSDVQELQQQFSGLQSEVVKTETMLAALAATLTKVP